MHFFFYLLRYRRFIAPTSLIAGALSPLLFAGCENNSTSDICQARCDCESCDATAESSCRAHMDQIVKVASDEGCKAQMEAYLSCAGDNAECTEKHYDLILGGPKVGPSAVCSPTFSDFQQCLFSTDTGCHLIGAFELECMK